MNTEYTGCANDGSTIMLSSDDTFTLQFHSGRELTESTVESLAESLTPESLLKLARTAASRQERQKAAEALRLWLAENFD